jgi:3-deoxy-D-manno-octulosonic-acid transferase
MLAAGITLAPVWVALVALRPKHRRVFFKRAFMPALEKRAFKGGQNGARIWIHALSVGEVLSAEPLVDALAKIHGAANLVFSASTFSGYETARRVISGKVGALRHFPYDTLFSVDRALRVFQPRWVVIVETDLWPNFLWRLKRRRIPVYLVNARLSENSFKGYRRIGFIMAPLLAVFARICVQTDADRRRFRGIGAADRQLITVGNMKFDQAPVDIPSGERSRLMNIFGLAPAAAVWVAGSTHPGEEQMLADACRKIRRSGIEAVLLVAPRDPGRADEVRGIFRRAGLRAMTLAEMESGAEPIDVVVIDRIGLLRKLYALADLAFVGGSLVKAGGHNPLEPASVARPVLFGPHTDDFAWICRTLEAAGGAIRIEDAHQLAEKVGELLGDKQMKRHVGRQAYGVFNRHRGAVTRTLAVLGDAAENRD